MILGRGTLLHSYLKILRTYSENVTKYSVFFLHRDVYVFMINLKYAKYVYVSQKQDETDSAITFHCLNWTNFHENSRSNYHLQRIFAFVFRVKFRMASLR